MRPPASGPRCCFAGCGAEKQTALQGSFPGGPGTVDRRPWLPVSSSAHWALLPAPTFSLWPSTRPDGAFPRHGQGPHRPRCAPPSPWAPLGSGAQNAMLPAGSFQQASPVGLTAAPASVQVWPLPRPLQSAEDPIFPNYYPKNHAVVTIWKKYLMDIPTEKQTPYKLMS